MSKLFTEADLISYLRSSVKIQTSDAIQDEAFLTMTDNDISMYLKIAVSKDYPGTIISKVPEESVYGIVLLAKKELYTTLATISAPLYNLEADGASLSQKQRFEHYMSLIEEVDKEYNKHIEEGGAGRVLTSYSVTLPNRYGTRYNMETAALPAPSLYVDEVGDTFVSLSWKVNPFNAFRNYKVYISDSQIVDDYKISDKVDVNAQCLFTITNKWQTRCKIQGLMSNKQYHVAVIASDMTGRTGYDEEVITTADNTVVTTTVTGA